VRERKPNYEDSVNAPYGPPGDALASMAPPPRSGAGPGSASMLRRVLVLLFACWLLGAGVASASPAFFISGRGWGHGVGMSQWGAYGYAQRGTTYDQILAHYYVGTELGNAPLARVRVLLGEGKKTVSIASDGPFRVRDGSGQVSELGAGAYALGPGLKLKVDPAAEPKPLTAPLLFLPGAEPLRYGNTVYRGQIQVNVGKNRLQVVNNVGLEPYLCGVVPREVPFTWPDEALKAQAVVARSYALAVRRTGAYDLYADTRSQVYGGVAAEKPSTNAAVDATARQVLLFEGKVATTYFFSTSGGRTASVADVWTGGEQIPYLTSVPDPYDTASPHHVWGPFAFTAKKLVSTFKVPGRLLDARVAVNPSQRVDTVTFVGSNGEVSVPGADVRTKLKLRSTWFRVGVLSLDPPAAPVEFGGQAKLTGLVRGSNKATLEQRVSGQVWEPAARATPGADGALAVLVRPLVSTDYRLAVATDVAGTPVRVSVAPRVRLQPVTEQTTLRGLVRPVVPGARVEVQRLAGAAWRTVGTSVLDTAGAFEAAVRLTPGTYRARVAPGRGLVPGVSPVLKVVSG
jgi:SpoIID/LytB domain protein